LVSLTTDILPANKMDIKEIAPS